METPTAMPERRSGISVFSGGISSPPCVTLTRMLTNRTGTAANSLVDVFNKIIEKRNCRLNYIIPISDNGGSSSELIRFVGGPSSSIFSHAHLISQQQTTILTLSSKALAISAPV
jgi:hypothetical protein